MTDSIQIDLKQIKSCEDHKIHFAEVLKAISCYSILLLVVCGKNRGLRLDEKKISKGGVIQTNSVKKCFVKIVKNTLLYMTNMA